LDHPFKLKYTPPISQVFMVFSCPLLSHYKQCKNKRIYSTAVGTKKNTAEDRGAVTAAAAEISYGIGQMLWNLKQ